MDFKKQPRQTGDPVVSSSYPVIEVLVQGADPITADIVFVHGLGGHLRDTWTKDNVCWPQDLLSKEEALSHIRVLTFGYDANIVDLDGRASLKTLFEHSINLVKELSRVRRKDAYDHPIIFIAHSFGGLIVKHALYYSNQVDDTHPHLAQIFSVTLGIIFLGTPHRGSGKTSIAKVVASVAQMALQNPPLHLIRDLERDSQIPDRIGDNFGRILDKQTLTVWSFAEELAITGVGKLVPAESAIIGDPRENRETIHGDHFSMVKFSTRDDPGYKKVVNSIEMLLERIGEGSLTPSKVKSDAVGLQEAKTVYVIPPLRVPYFVGREALLTRLQALFDYTTTDSAPLIVVLIGMGGVGKTQLALEYCRRMKDMGKFRAIFWLDASSHHTLYSSMETAAKHLIPDRVFDNPDVAVASVKDVLSTWSEQWLLVFDNLDNPEDLPGIVSFFPDSHRGSILVTSRLAASKKLGQSIELDCMEKEEGLQLLLRSSGGDTDEVDAAGEILSLLGNLPLAIDQARAYISKRQLRLRAFVTEYEGRKQSVMQETPQLWQYKRMLPGKEKEVPLNLLTTWEMSLQFLGVGEQAAELEKVITLFAFFNPVNIGERLFNNGADDRNPTTSPMTIFKEDGHWNHLKFENAVVKMQDLSLLRFSHCNESEIAVSLHPMVSEWLRMRLDKSSQSTFLIIAISHLQSHLGSIGHSDHKTRQEAQAHVDTIWQGVESFNLDDHVLEACITFGNFYRDQGRLKDAEMVYNRALAGCERVLGPEHTSTLDTVNNLGLLCIDQGRCKDAETMCNRALAGYEEAFGPEHPSTLGAVNNLGLLYIDQGRLKDAETMYNRALAGYEKAFGPEHTSTLNAVNNLGLLYSNQGRLRDAETMYNRALAGYEGAFGPEHTSMLNAVNNLGLLYSNQGRLNNAEIMYNRALAGYEKAFGPEHTSTLNTVNNLGLLYSDQGRFKDAEVMHDRALAGKEKVLGPEHTSTLDTVNNLGNLYSDQGRLKDAGTMYNRALAGYEKAFGPEHTSTLGAVNNLGVLYSNQGRLKDTEMMYDRALAGYEKTFGPEHTSTLDAVNNLGNLYSNQGRYQDAEMMYDRALAGREKTLGPDHTSTLNAVNNLGLLYSNQGRLKDAEIMYNRALAGYEKAFGPEHTSTLNAVNNLGLLYSNQGRLNNAKIMYNRALAGKEKVLGPEHTSTLNTVNNLGNLYSDQGRFKDAEVMYDRALAGYEKALGPEHTSTLNAVNNLGLLYSNQGRLNDAEIMYNRALAGYEKIFGPEHTSTLGAVNNLGLLYIDQGRLENAAMMYNCAPAGREKVLRPEHTSTLGTHATLASAVSESSNACLNAAVDVMDRLVENKGGIEALFHTIGINHKDVAVAAGFDEEVFASSGILIQQAYMLTRVDLAVDEDQIMHLLDALGKMLSPHSGVVSTPSRKYYFPAYLPSSGISSHNNPSGVPQESLAKGRGASDGNQQGNDQKQTEGSGSNHEVERKSPHSDSASGGNSGDAEGNNNLVETDNSEVEQMSSVRHVASGFPPNDGPPETSKAGHNVYFQVKFNIKHMCMANQTIIVEGTVQSEEIPKTSLPHAAPHVILSTRIQFLGLDFYGNSKTGYRQSCVVVKIDAGKDQGRFQLFDVNPQPTPRQDTKMKQVESTERTGQHQMGISTNFSFPPLKPTIGGSYNYTTLRKSGTTQECSVNINRISQTRTGRDMYWCYTVDDEYFQEDGLRNLTPSASFSFFGAEKPEKLKTEVKSIWTMPDSGVWNIYTRFTNTVPLRNLATQVAFDIPPHMNRSWTVLRDLAVTMIPRDKGFGVKTQVEFSKVYGDIESQDFHAFIT